MFRRLTLLSLPFLASSLAAAVDPTANSIAGESSYPYRLFVPTPASPATPLPLIVYLAGLGEKGTDNRLQVLRFIQPMLEITQRPNSDCAAYFVAPQSPSGWWSGAKVNTLVDEIVASYPIDQSRLYLIGLSAGGGGCYVTLADRPDRWAAAICLSAVKDAPSIPKISSVPVWLIHGDQDDIVPCIATFEVYRELCELGSHPRLTILKGVKHGPWTPIFADDRSYTGSYAGGDPTHPQAGLYPWLFAQCRDNP